MIEHIENQIRMLTVMRAGETLCFNEVADTMRSLLAVATAFKEYDETTGADYDQYKKIQDAADQLYSVLIKQST